MLFQQVRKLLEQTAQYCVERDIDCPQETLNNCVVEYDTLLAATGDHTQTLSIFESLLAMALEQENPCGWLLGELRFEAYVARVGMRCQQALFDLQQQDRVDDEVLDRYNERINRFLT